MFGFHVGKDWASDARKDVLEHVMAARRFFDRTFTSSVARFAFQIFVAGPRNARFNVSLEAAHRLRDYIREENDSGGQIWGVAHGTYLDNPWNTDKANHVWTLKWIKNELRRAASAGLAGLVIHLGVPDPERVVSVLPWLMADPPESRPRPGEKPRVEFTLGGDDVVEADEELDLEDTELDYSGCRIISSASVMPGRGSATEKHRGGSRRACVRMYLEVPHVLPRNSHYETPEKLAALFRLIRERIDPELSYFGLCIDTAHIWACGADIRLREDAQRWLEGLEAIHDIIPPEAIMFHLNDNRNALGSGIDEHDPLLYGAIWGDFVYEPWRSGLVAFLDYARRYNIPTILERGPQKNAEEAELGTATGAISSDLRILSELA